MKRLLLVLGTVVLFLNTLAIPTIARADGGGGNGGCGPVMCKP
jgi:hypothetical protein